MLTVRWLARRFIEALTFFVSFLFAAALSSTGGHDFLFAVRTSLSYLIFYGVITGYLVFSFATNRIFIFLKKSPVIAEWFAFALHSTICLTIMYSGLFWVALLLEFSLPQLNALLISMLASGAAAIFFEANNASG